MGRNRPRKLNPLSAEFELHVSESLGRIEAELKALGGEQGRVTKIEEEMQTQNRRQWIHSLVVTAISAIGITFKRVLHGG